MKRFVVEFSRHTSHMRYAALGNDPAALERWNEKKRSSLNNICKAARLLAKHLRDSTKPVTRG